MGDDGLGPSVLARLQAGHDFPPGVALLDAGTPGQDLTLFLEGLRALVVVDALKARGAPGEVRTYRKADLLRHALPQVMSPHEPSLREALLRLELLGNGPREVLLVGAIPARVETGGGLTEPVRCALPQLEALVLQELARLGVPATARPGAAPADLWWEPLPAHPVHRVPPGGRS
jgi:hydrogenase maturation protease